MVNAMNKVFRDCIMDITMSFLEDILIKGCPEAEKDATLDEDGCRSFVNFCKAFDVVPRERLFDRLKSLEIPNDIIWAIYAL